MDEKRKRVDYSQQLIYNGREFKSIAEFAVEFSLKYTSVVYHLKRGRTAEEIIKILDGRPVGSKYKADTPNYSKRQKVSYGGVEYPSITAACSALGIKIYEVYEKTKRGIPADIALREIIEEHAERGAGTDSGVHQPVAVGGVIYGSKAEACNAYQIPYQTIMARMQRKNISFEEAILRGSKARYNYTPYESMWGGELCGPYPVGTDLVEDLGVEETNEERRTQAQKGFQTIIDALLKNPYPDPRIYFDKGKQVIGIAVQEKLHPLGPVRDVYLLFRLPWVGYQMDFELVIPGLLEISKRADLEGTEILKEINKVNSRYPGANVFLDDSQAIVVKGLYTASTKQFNTSLLFRGIHRFVGTAAAIYDALLQFES